MDIREVFRVLSVKLEDWLEYPVEMQCKVDPFHHFWNYMLGPIRDKRSRLQRWISSPEAALDFVRPHELRESEKRLGLHLKTQSSSRPLGQNDSAKARFVYLGERKHQQLSSIHSARAMRISAGYKMDKRLRLQARDSEPPG